MDGKWDTNQTFLLFYVRKVSLFYLFGLLRELEISKLTETPSPVKTEVPQEPALSFIKMGMFPRIPAPYSVAFAGHRQPWEASLEGIIEYCTQYGGPALINESKKIVTVNL
jgi:hypothetical protein